MLPFGLTPEDLKATHASRPRNPNITNVFYRRGLIEAETPGGKYRLTAKGRAQLS